MQKKNNKRIRLKKRIRVKIKGTETRPRLTVFRSNKFIYAQIINDLAGKTLVQASDVKVTKGTKTERAKEVGRLIGALCLKIKISKVVFDRNGFKYTGRIKTVADEARASGLQF
ncbi:50S ribosomal protein L18 [Candidatus Nomurabacteria bacterium RIFCSPLOWO2_01_FULL_41_12]|uniref:Large ribosomal subunit protein uL18 n=1 Tax=Candidatus Nomurabacteria bacterium RIFCSPLOWO2_01_FULL_41_12 TaxID=1801774 RepID=A0A1F6WXY7_9BACT|nr:MAG: 50S ribosomal protein L18 [Candidatus Nomurabacteria bacterium RIFCSPLOWO2_01_FULL_41_12]